MRELAVTRLREYTAKMAARVHRRNERSRLESEANTAQAADVRRRFR
jgi:hypothetical protein